MDLKGLPDDLIHKIASTTDCKSATRMMSTLRMTNYTDAIKARQYDKIEPLLTKRRKSDETDKAFFERVCTYHDHHGTPNSVENLLARQRLEPRLRAGSKITIWPGALVYNATRDVNARLRANNPTVLSLNDVTKLIDPANITSKGRVKATFKSWMTDRKGYATITVQKKKGPKDIICPASAIRRSNR